MKYLKIREYLFGTILIASSLILSHAAYLEGKQLFRYIVRYRFNTDVLNSIVEI